MFAVRWRKSKCRFNFLLTLALVVLSGCKNPFGETKIGEDFHPGVEISFADSVLSLSIDSASNSQSKQATTQSAQVTAGSSINLVINLKDKNGNAYISNSVSIALTASGGSSVGSFSSAVNNKDGTYTVIYSASQAGTPVTVTGSVNGQSLSGSATIEVLPATNVSTTYPFSVGTESSYTSSNSFSSVEITAGGILRLKPVDQTDDDNSSSGFAGGTMTGVQWDSALNALRLNTTTNNAELDSSWAPQWGNLVGYWKLNGIGAISNGTTVSATLGTNGTAVNTNGTGLSYASGLMNQGISFDGVDDVIALGSSTALNTVTSGNHTISAWVKPTGTQGIVIGKYGFHVGIAYGYNSSGGTAANQFSYMLWNSSNTNIGATTTSGTFTAGNWYHVVAVIDDTNGSVKIYVNGIQQASSAFTPGAVLRGYSTGVFSIGAAYLNSGTVSRFFTGTIDDVAVWSTVLSQTEVTALYTRQLAKYSGVVQSRVMDALSSQTWTALAASETLPFYKELPGAAGNETSSDYSSAGGTLMNGLTGLWHFDGDALDSSGNGHNGSLSGTAVVTETQALFNKSLNSGNGNASLGTWFDVSNRTAFSFSSWFYVNSFGSWDRIVKFRPGSNVNGRQDYNCWVYSTSSTLSCEWFVDNAYVNSVAVTSLSAGKWYLLTVTSDGTTFSLYLDGKLRGTRTVPNFSNIGNQLTVGPGTSNVLIDEVASWSRVLTASEILELYRRGANRLKYQVRSCANSDCSDQEALTSNYKGWKGPDNTGLTYFSELYNTTNNVLGGTVSTGSPTMTFANFSGSGLSVSANRYFQYRTILESDDQNSLCTYGGSAANCSPELKSVSVGPVHYDSSSPSVYTNTGLSFYSLSTMTQTLGVSCSSGITYNLSLDKTNWYYWDVTASGGSGAWALANGTVARSNTASTINSHLSSFGNQVGRGTVYTKFYLGSSGLTPCEIDSLKLEGLQ